jgi:CRP-like cAMP-binding protein
MPYDSIENGISEKITLLPRETGQLKTFFTPKKLRKRQYLLQEGEVCKFLAFTEKGLLRLYSVDDKGIEHMMQFAMEGWWIVDIYSFLTGEPSRYNIDAMEDSELLLLSHENFEAMMKALPVMERYFRILFQNNIIAKERRLESSITHGAEERYRQFEQTYPNFIRRIPLNLIASYLGITPETLSRIRRNLARKK